MIAVYVTCESVEQAKSIGKTIMSEKLAGCINIFPEVIPVFFWPPKSGKFDETKEVVLLIKSIESKYKTIEKRVKELHSYDTVCVFALPVKHVIKEYYDWLTGEIV